MARNAIVRIGASMLVLCALVTSLHVEDARASTVERVQRLDPFGNPYDSYYIEYTAAAGEANELEIRVDTGGLITFRDGGAALAAKGCEPITPSTARCRYGDSLSVELGDGDDVARVVDARVPQGKGLLPRMSFTAGAGADSITGGPGDDEFVDGGGSGESDRFAGGEGDDLVSYAEREEPVRITIGSPGEDALDGIETVEGGSGDDVLTGDARANSLWGGPGDDVVRGLGGDDELGGSGGSDRLYGGPGDDVLIGDSYTSAVGRDRLEGGRGDDFLDAGVLDDNSYSIGGPEYEPSSDRRKDVVHGGPGYDAFNHRDRNDGVRNCEAAALGSEFTFARSLRRVSRSTVRVRVGLTPSELSEATRIVLSPRGKRGPRLTKPISIFDEGTVTLRLTPAGIRYLRHRAGVTITSLSTDETIDARVSRRRRG